MVIWPWIAGFLLLGYLTMGRSFAYLGIPPIFIGEVVLAAFLLLKPRIALGTWAASLLRPSPLNGLGLTLLAFMAYGLWQVGRGVLGGYPVVHTLKFFTFNYYTLYLFMGLWIGLHTPDFLPKLIRVIAWVNGIYGVIYHRRAEGRGGLHPGNRRAAVLGTGRSGRRDPRLAVLRARSPGGLVRPAAQHRGHAGVAGAGRVGRPGAGHPRLGRSSPVGSAG